MDARFGSVRFGSFVGTTASSCTSTYVRRLPTFDTRARPTGLEKEGPEGVDVRHDSY